MLSKEKRELIAIATIRVLRGRFESFPDDASRNRNAPFHAAFLNAFSDKLRLAPEGLPYFVSLSSWFHGLNTTMGQTFFERVAHALSDGEKREFSPEELRISQEQKHAISQIMTELKNRRAKPNLVAENKRIFLDEKSKLAEAEKFAVDNYAETSTTIEAIELKTVRPNSGIAFGEKEKILKAKAALWQMYPHKEIKFFLGFPFDPLSHTATGSDKLRLMEFLIEFDRYFDPAEVLVAEELWDRLSGTTNTMQDVLDIINNIATPKFLEEYAFLMRAANRRQERTKYLTLLEKWCLSRELDLAKNDKEIEDCCNEDKRIERIFHQPIFSHTSSILGEYNQGRVVKLLERLTQATTKSMFAKK